MNPTLEALHKLGGSGTISEILEEVSEIMDLSDQQREVLHNSDKSSQTAIAYRLGWTRTYLKKHGLLENSSRGVWALTAQGRNTASVDSQFVKRIVVQMDREKSRKTAQHLLDETEDLATKH